ncbi:MAG: nucleotidyltransferase [Myxococcales bacterium]|nr:nucleotidyltransferase [Myxococcales bacterium]
MPTTTTPKIPPDLREFLFCLLDHGVRFVVAGAYVLATLGRPRYSEDLDLLVEPTPDNAGRLAEALRSFGGFEELADAAREHFTEPERMATLGRPPIAIDILSSLTGLSFEEAWSGHVEIEIEGRAVPFLGKEQFIKTKRAAGRTKDKLDLELLREAGLLED